MTQEQHLDEALRFLLKWNAGSYLYYLDNNKNIGENFPDRNIKDGAVGKNSHEDALHIAIATIHRVDVLVSWNFKHIVNLDRIRKYNAVNLMNGYPMIEIRNPREILK